MQPTCPRSHQCDGIAGEYSTSRSRLCPSVTAFWRTPSIGDSHARDEKSTLYPFMENLQECLATRLCGHHQQVGGHEPDSALDVTSRMNSVFAFVYRSRSFR